MSFGSGCVAKSVAIGGCASCAATVFTNPLEVAKSRLQLQGELGASVRPYRNFVHALGVIVYREGPLALQKGLLAAWGYQFVGNGTRLATFDAVKSSFGSNGGIPTTLACGAIAGLVSCPVAQPFYLVKVRLQVSSNAAHSVGQQHGYASPLQGVLSIVRRDGVPGLWRGLEAVMARTVVASAVQLSTYNEAKSFFERRTGDQPLLNSLLASFTAGLAITTAIEPFDVIATRLCNQSGQTYSGVLDCFYKTLRAEGTYGLYKGWTTNYARTGPHTVLIFLFWERFKGLADRLA
eukprot:TRINITY_DN122884_c0_g1_i1.p1 TRINITY_DN122884_c0_g1~~TRINITY_DN122884_c0_g1_i1.p1  ORF type:complete len:293 (-),score=10.66 TRINITY_DN122884_c0_g1_i1:129-1007(-)